MVMEKVNKPWELTGWAADVWTTDDMSSKYSNHSPKVSQFVDCLLITVTIEFLHLWYHFYALFKSVSWS